MKAQPLKDREATGEASTQREGRGEPGHAGLPSHGKHLKEGGLREDLTTAVSVKVALDRIPRTGRRKAR